MDRPPALLSRVVALLIAAGLFTACAPIEPTQAASAETREFTIRPGLLERSYRVYQPASYDGSKPVPLVLSLHGGWGTSKSQQQIAGWDKLADQHGFLVAYPEGLYRSWNAGDCCAKAQEKQINDIGYLRATIEQIRKDYRVDTQRIYGNGFSNGGMLLAYVACNDPGLFTAIALNAATLMTKSCSPDSGLPVLVIQGREDSRIPWDGGTVENTYRMPIRDLVRKLAGNNRCDSKEEAVSYSKGPATCKTVKGCGKNEVTYCGVEGVGHQWIGGVTLLPKLLGKNTDQFNATQTMWDFFGRHPGG
ncbi:MAG: alpha/beta hydrolase family esterase [Panacagrimonas sp.]